MPDNEETESRCERLLNDIPIPTARFLKPEQHILVRILTIAIILAGFGATVKQCVESTLFYLSSPTSVSVYETDYKDAKMPAIVLCPPGQFIKGRAIAVLFDQEGKNELLLDELLSMEADRSKFVKLILNRTKPLTNGVVKEMQSNLSLIVKQFALSKDNDNHPQSEELFNRLKNLLLEWEDIFPSSMNYNYFSRYDNIPNSSHDISYSTAFPTFDKFQRIQELYDYCAIRYKKSESELIACRLWHINELCGNSDNGGRCVTTGDIEEDGLSIRIRSIDYYSRLITLSRPALEDVVLHCLWFGRSCNVTSVWTVNGKCFRIAPENSDDEITDSFGNGKVVQFLIDTLKFNFPFKVPMVYLYQMNETGFAMKDGGFNIEPGKFTQLAISQTRQNIRAKQNCSRMDLKHFGDKWKYTKEKCEWEMSTSMIEEKCNCTSDLAPNYSFITDDQIFCLTHADSKCGDSGMWGGEQFSVIANRQQKFFDNDSNYCSFADAFYCAPKHLELNEKFNCPDNCFEITYDIDLVTSAIDIVKVAESVPGQNFLTDDCGGCASSMDNNLKGVHAVDDFRTMPGAKQLYHMINKLFQNYLQLLNAFWWKADESPYYPAFFKMFSNGDMDDNAFSFEKYIEDGGLRLGCLPDDFTFFTDFDKFYEERRLAFVSVLNFTLTTYTMLHNNWTTDYVTQALLPFSDILEKELAYLNESNNYIVAQVKVAVLKKMLFTVNSIHQNVENGYIAADIIVPSKLSLDSWSENYASFENLTQNSTLAKFWLPAFIPYVKRNYENAINGKTLAEQADTSVSYLLGSTRVDAETDERNIFNIFIDWLKVELDSSVYSIDYSEGTIYDQSIMFTIAQAFILQPHDLDVYSIAQNYAPNSKLRDNLKLMLFNISKKIDRTCEAFPNIGTIYYNMLWDGEDTNYGYFSNLYMMMTDGYMENHAFEKALYQDSVFVEQIDKLRQCFQIRHIEFCEKRATSNDTFKKSKKGDQTTWFDQFIDMIDKNLYYYTPPRGYIESSFAEVGVYFRSFRVRTVEQSRSYLFNDFLNDIGGAIGLWIGASVITVYEIILIFFTSRAAQAKNQEAPRWGSKRTEEPIQHI